MPLDAERKRQDEVRKFLRTALERFHLAVEAEQKNRDASLDDLKFRTGDQWPDNIETSRTNDGRPCLTINRLPSMIRSL